MNFSNTTRKLPVVQKQQECVRKITVSIAFHPDCERIGQYATCDSLHQGKAFSIQRNSPEFMSAPADVCSPRPIDDPYISRSPLTIFLEGEEIVFQAPLKKTILRVNNQFLRTCLRLPVAELERGITLSLSERVVLVVHWHYTDGRSHNEGFLLGMSAGMKAVRDKIALYGPGKRNVLIRGETGTGKELVARALHQSSDRVNSTFLPINMAAIPASLATSELFGSTRGAFSGASKYKPGLLEEANGGTLFMDEIGDAGPDLQGPLLRVLDTGDVQPVGGLPRKVSVRFISATDAPLERLLKERRFSHALLERLSTLVIELPALRDRREDIGLLIDYFIRAEDKELSIGFYKKLQASAIETQNFARAVEWACNFQWPGNVRQLRAWVQRLLIENAGDAPWVLPNADNFLCFIPPQPEASSEKGGRNPENVETPTRALSSISSNELHSVLKACRWELTAAAKELKISRAALYKLIDRSPSIRRARDISRDELNRHWEQSKGDIQRMADTLEVSASALKRRLHEAV